MLKFSELSCFRWYWGGEITCLSIYLPGTKVRHKIVTSLFRYGYRPQEISIGGETIRSISRVFA
jgi:hypothetical protein